MNEVRPNALETIASPSFQQTLTEARKLALDNDDREVGFNTWVDESSKVTINRPALGEVDCIYDHLQGEHVYPPGTGFNVGPGGEVVVISHTHPFEGGENAWTMSAPSILDFTFLANIAHQNLNLALLHDRDSWTNPIGLVANAHDSNLAIYQVKSEVIEDDGFYIEGYIEEARVAVWAMFKHFFPQHAKRQSGDIYDNFSPKGFWFPRGWLPKFVLNENRYSQYLDLVNARMTRGDLASLAKTSCFEFVSVQLPTIEVAYEHDDPDEDVNIDDYIDYLEDIEAES